MMMSTLDWVKANAGHRFRFKKDSELSNPVWHGFEGLIVGTWASGKVFVLFDILTRPVPSSSFTRDMVDPYATWVVDKAKVGPYVVPCYANQLEEVSFGAPPMTKAKRVIPDWPHVCRCGAPALELGFLVDCSRQGCPAGNYKRGYPDQDNHGTALDLMGFPASMLAVKTQKP